MATHRSHPYPGLRAGRTATTMHGDTDPRGGCWLPVGSEAVVASAARRVAKNGIGVQHLRQAELVGATGFLRNAVLAMGIGMELAQPPPVGAGQLADLGIR